LRNLFRNRKFQIAILVIVLIIISLISLNRFSSINLVKNIVSIPVTFIQKEVKDISDNVSSFFASIRDYSDVIGENKQLKKKLSILEEKSAKTSNIEEENKRLRDALVLKEHFANFNFVSANVLSINPSNYKYEFTVDVGSIDNVKIDNPVIASNNALLGRVYQTDLTSAKIIPITDELSGVSGWISREGGGNVTIRGSINLKQYGLCIVENIPQDTKIVVGDVVETSGLGGIYPKGIIVGTIVEIFNSDSQVNRYAYLKPLVDMKILSEVYILTKKDIK